MRRASTLTWPVRKQLIRACIKQHRKVLGICLGAQLIADALGEKIFRNREKEIGWFPVQTDVDAVDREIFLAFPGTFTPFHWHGETFDLPQGAWLLGSSTACRTQGFLFGDHVLALQFHLEITPEIIEGLLKHASDDLTEGLFVHSVREIREGLGTLSRRTGQYYSIYLTGSWDLYKKIICYEPPCIGRNQGCFKTLW